METHPPGALDAIGRAGVALDEPHDVLDVGYHRSQKWHTMHFCQDALGSHFYIGIGFDGREAMWIC